VNSYRLPYPPTMNTYWRKYRGRITLSARGRQYKRDVQAVVGPQPPRLVGPLAVTLSVWLPDRRKRDLDNLIKPVLDACTAAGVWIDDSQVAALSIARLGVRKPGATILQVSEMR
jgi:crossover junction endodeoxyribonuclease RusA